MTDTNVRDDYTRSLFRIRALDTLAENLKASMPQPWMPIDVKHLEEAMAAYTGEVTAILRAVVPRFSLALSSGAVPAKRRSRSSFGRSRSDLAQLHDDLEAGLTEFMARVASRSPPPSLPMTARLKEAEVLIDGHPDLRAKLRALVQLCLSRDDLPTS
ncbi:MAG: hypothetical protein AMXMBFR64_41070 [Myxococcales bacterium]